MDQPAPELCILNPCERFVEPAAFGRRQEGCEITNVFSAFPPNEGGRSTRRLLEEIRDRHLQKACNLLEPTRADAIDALLVFLNLLEGDAEVVAKLLLALALHHSARVHAIADMNVNRIGVRVLQLGFSPRIIGEDQPSGSQIGRRVRMGVSGDRRPQLIDLGDLRVRCGRPRRRHAHRRRGEPQLQRNYFGFAGAIGFIFMGGALQLVSALIAAAANLNVL